MLTYQRDKIVFCYLIRDTREEILDPEILRAIGQESLHFGVRGGRGRNLVIGEIVDPIQTTRNIPIIASRMDWKRFEAEKEERKLRHP